MKIVVLLLLVLYSQAQAFADCVELCKLEKKECLQDVQKLVDEKLPDDNKLALFILKRIAVNDCKDSFKECKQECVE